MDRCKIFLDIMKRYGVPRINDALHGRVFVDNDFILVVADSDNATRIEAAQGWLVTAYIRGQFINEAKYQDVEKLDDFIRSLIASHDSLN